jgi:hypothetical protein
MLLLSLTMAAALTVGGPMPDLQGKDLTGKEVRLPKDAEGKVTLLILGFTYDSRHAVGAWAKRYKQEFERLPKVEFYEIPMIGGMARMGKWFIGSGMRRGTPEGDHKRVITVYGGTGDWKKRVGYRAKDAAYLILLDRQGRVRFLHSGGMNDAAWRKLASATRQWAQSE